MNPGVPDPGSSPEIFGYFSGCASTSINEKKLHAGKEDLSPPYPLPKNAARKKSVLQQTLFKGKIASGQPACLIQGRKSSWTCKVSFKIQTCLASVQYSSVIYSPLCLESSFIQFRAPGPSVQFVQFSSVHELFRP